MQSTFFTFFKRGVRMDRAPRPSQVNLHCVANPSLSIFSLGLHSVRKAKKKTWPVESGDFHSPRAAGT